MKTGDKVINGLLTTGIILFTAIMLYVLLKSGFRPSGNLQLYLLISAAGIVIFSAVLIKGTGRGKANFLLLLTSLVICVYMTEFLIEVDRFMRSPTVKDNVMRAELNKEMGLPFDSRDSYQVMMDFKKDGSNAYPNIIPNKFVYTDGLAFNETKIYPLSSLSEMTTILCNESGEFVIYTSDRYGFRNPDRVYESGFVDIALIGDSFAHGNCVRGDQDVSGWLRKAGKHIVNLGMQASGPLIELAILKEYVPPLKPKYVFWMYFEGNDDRDLIKEKNSSTLLMYLDTDFSQNLLSREKFLDNAMTSYLKKEINSKERNLKEDRDDKNTFTINVRETIQLENIRFKLSLLQGCFFQIDPLLKDIFMEAKRMVHGWGGQFNVVYIPSWERYQKSVLCRKRLLSLQHSQVTALLQELDIPFIDINQILDSHEDPYSLYPYRLRVTGHFNSKGYNLIAKAILDHVK